MVNEARSHESEDRKRRELVEARNLGDSLAYQTEKTLRELGDKVQAGERKDIEEKITALRQAIKGDDIARIKQLQDDLQNAFHALSQQLYAQGAQAGTTSPPGNGHGRGHSPDGEGEVIEGEFREA